MCGTWDKACHCSHSSHLNKVQEHDCSMSRQTASLWISAYEQPCLTSLRQKTAKTPEQLLKLSVAQLEMLQRQLSSIHSQFSWRSHYFSPVRHIPNRQSLFNPWHPSATASCSITAHTSLHLQKG